MTNLYVPKHGERVRVLKAKPGTKWCGLLEGTEIIAHNIYLSFVLDGWVYVRWVTAVDIGGWKAGSCLGAYVLVEPVEARDDVRRDERFCESCSAGAHGPLAAVECQLVPTAHGEQWLCEGCAREALSSETIGPTPPPERRFCACGQELMGTWAKSEDCGECRIRWANRDETCPGRPSFLPQKPPAQEETIEHAWQTPGDEWPL